MSTFANDSDYDDPETGDEPEAEAEEGKVPRSQIRSLEKKAKRADEAETRAQTAERKLAALRARPDLNDDQIDALISTHKGEFTPEELGETVKRLGWAPAAESETTDPEVPAEELAAHDRVAETVNAPRSEVNADAELDKRLAEARTPEEFEAIYRNSGRPHVWNEQ